MNALSPAAPPSSDSSVTTTRAVRLADSYPIKRPRPYYTLLRYLCAVGYVVYFRGRVFGMANVPLRGPVLVVCNHQSFFDPISAACAITRECHYMARDTLFTNPFFGRLISSVNAFPVKRGTGDVGAVKEILRRLKAGEPVLVFPEGTRSPDGEIGQINPNSLLIAKRAGAAIVPTVVDGAFEAWPRTQVFPNPQSTYVSYSKPISITEVAEWPIERIAETVDERMREAMARSRRLRARANGKRV